MGTNALNSNVGVTAMKIGKKVNNQHLAVVFNEILPFLARAGIKYYVFWGVGVAGVIGKFIRENNDVDIYVLNEDFESVKKLLKNFVLFKKDLKLRTHKPLPVTRRPKFDIYNIMRGKELLSVVPAYKTEGGVEFRVKTAMVLPEHSLDQEPKTVMDFEFFSPPKDTIKAILKSLFVERPKELLGGKRRYDAMAVFTKEEFGELEKRASEQRQKKEMDTPQDIVEFSPSCYP